MNRNLFFVLGSAVLGAVPLVAVSSFADAFTIQLVLLVLLNAILMAIGLWGIRERKAPLLADPLFYTMVFLAQFFVIGPLAVHFVGLPELMFAFRYEPSRMLEVLVASAAMLTALLIGYKVRIGMIVASWMPGFERSPRKVESGMAEWLLTAACLMNVIGWLQYNGGLLDKLASGYGRWRPGGALFNIGFMALPTIVSVIAWRVFSDARSRSRARYLMYALLGFLLLFFGIVYGVRKYLLFIFFGMLVVWVLHRGVRRLPTVKLAATAALLLVFFAVWGAIRFRPLTESVGAERGERYQERELYSGYTTGVGEPFSIACLVFELFPDVEPYRMGDTLKVTLFGFIPRALWPEKPIGIGKEITKYLVGPFYEPTHGYSAATTILGDFYLNFGWVGIVLGGFVIGFACRVVLEYAATGMVDGTQPNPARVLVPAVFIMGLGEVRTDMSTMLMSHILLGWPLIVMLTFFNLPRPIAIAKPSSPPARLPGPASPWSYDRREGAMR